MEKKERIKTEKQLYLENKELRSRLAEAEEALAAIRSGKVDAILVSGDNGEKVFSLASAETPYRIIIEEMSEGAVILSKDGLILYCNNRFAELVSVPLEQIAGSYFTRFVEESYGSKYDALLQAGLKGNSTGEIACIDRGNNPVPLHLSFRRLHADMPGT
ncbi:MAG: PAS domain-containing protein, partial [Spirochaetaceae bacterium]